MPYEWTPDLHVGIDEIDAQHREVLSRITALHRSMLGGNTASLPTVLTGLRSYVEEHFRTEERHMRESRFPSLARHAAQHARFADEFAVFEREWSRRGTTPTLAVDLAAWLSAWFREHIRGSDRELAAFLRASRKAAD